LGMLQTGALRLRDQVSALNFGPAAETDNALEIQVHDFRAYPALALKGTLGAADSPRWAPATHGGRSSVHCSCLSCCFVFPA
jgi:hypothetical protein